MSETGLTLRRSRESQLSERIASQPWEYAEAETQSLTHNLHRYSGKFIPQVAARAITLLTEPGEIVLDPYCGSGTTLLEALLLGRRAVGVDLSPLAILIARTKVRPMAQPAMKSLRLELQGSLQHLQAQHELSLLGLASSAERLKRDLKQDSRFQDHWFRKWYQPTVLAELLAIDHAIRSIPEPHLRALARVAFSDILRRSSNAHPGYPNVMFDKGAPTRQQPIGPFLKALERVCQQVSSLERVNAEWSNSQVIRSSATCLPLADSSVDAVVSHPPYIGSIPYAEYGLLSLKWLGIDPKGLDHMLTGGRRQSSDVVQRFEQDYGSMMAEAARVLRPGRHMFLMVGNPLVRGVRVDLAQMSIELGQRAGFSLLARATRKGVNRRANKMGEEHLLFFQNSS
jgi:SAM-dependent methyltransferase